MNCIPIPTAERAEQQSRSMVKAFVSTGSFAARTACRAGESPTPGRQSPMKTPSTSFGSMGRFSITFRIAKPPNSGDGTSLNDPPKRPKGVLFPFPTTISSNLVTSGFYDAPSDVSPFSLRERREGVNGSASFQSGFSHVSQSQRWAYREERSPLPPSLSKQACLPQG